MSGLLNVKMSFKVTEDMKTKLELMVENENKKVSEIIRECITENINKNKLVKPKLKTSKAFEVLEDGGKIQEISWDKDEYIEYDEYGNLVDETGNLIDISIKKDMEWYIVI